MVCDLKATDDMKLFHRIQAALYSLILEHVLAAARLPLRPSGRGSVWLFGAARLEPFALSHVRPLLETFLIHDLAPLLRAPARDAFWHLYFKCEWCDFYGHCRGESEAAGDVSLVPYLSTFAKRHLTPDTPEGPLSRVTQGSAAFVDTVEKMQGQECDAVCVSYGVADVEFALMEREFIYSLNRLNVAIRGRE